MADDTSIRVSEDLADELYDRKGRGTSYEEFIWQLLDRVDEIDDDRADADAADDDAATARETVVNETATRDAPTPAGDDGPSHDAADGALPDVRSADVSGSGEKEDERIAAVRAALEYLREQGSAKAGGFKDDVYPDHDGQYASPRSWWKNCIYPAFVAIAERDDRLERADTTGVWTWRGGDQ